MSRIFIPFEYPAEGISGEPEDEQTAAEPIFRAIVKCLQSHVEMLSGPDPWDNYGWYCKARSGSIAFTCMMQRSDGWLLQVFQRQTLLQRLGHKQDRGGLHRCATTVAAAVQQALDVPQPSIKSEAEFTNSTF